MRNSEWGMRNEERGITDEVTYSAFPILHSPLKKPPSRKRKGGQLKVSFSKFEGASYPAAAKSSTCLASRFRATCKRRLIVPKGASKSSAISSKL